MSIHHRLVGLLFMTLFSCADCTHHPAAIEITDEVLRPASLVPPLGANHFGRSGAVEWAANNFIFNPGNEPIHWQNLHRATRVGPGWFEIDGLGTSWGGLWGDGFLSGAEVRIYRLVDAEGRNLPTDETGEVDAERAARGVLEVGRARVVPEGARGRPRGGWVANLYATVHPFAEVGVGKLSVTDTYGVENDQTYWYRVAVLGPDGEPTGWSEEVSARPSAELGSPPRPMAGETSEPPPPSSLRAVAGDGLVHLAWKPATAGSTARFRVQRSTVPRAEQASRVYLEAGAPKLEVGDYIVVEHRFDTFPMSKVGVRARGASGAFDRPSWPWQFESDLELALVPHPGPRPLDMADVGQTCLRVDASTGAHALHQVSMVGLGIEGENLWYGQLEPGKKYAWEGWVRARDEQTIRLSFRPGYLKLSHPVEVSPEWTRFSWRFVAPEREAGEVWHFGPRIDFSGPTTLWLDEMRLSRYDAEQELTRTYTPNRTVLDELVAAQPPEGDKGVHRTWYLERGATMDGLLGWRSNSTLSGDAYPQIRQALDMTLPMGLEFDLRTGERPERRVRPWLVLAHLLHDEQDWLHLIEWLAAPYDPAVDSEATKPYAFLRYRQRGRPEPWVDEFEEIIIELGNETWHNGAVDDDWIGFATRDAVHEGGRAYGLFSKYIIDVMRSSPYWNQRVDDQIRFALGANYDGRIDGDAVVRGYGEEAMQANPAADILGHANYVGPKWETGEVTRDEVSDEGYRSVLRAWVAGVRADMRRMSSARDRLAATHHPYELMAYEGGPTGFALPGQASPNRVEVAERYGKSKAMAIAALDAWMGSYALGWTDQAFLGFGQGTHWNSHTPLGQGFRPSAGWVALTLRNRVGRGDLMKTRARNLPELEGAGETYPGVGAYAMRDAGRWSVFLLSRRLDPEGPKAEDGAGDGDTQLSLRLPFASARQLTVHRLTGGPRDTNRFEDAVRIETRPLDPSALVDGRLVIDRAVTGADRDGLPPGGVLVLVFHVGVESTEAGDPR